MKDRKPRRTPRRSENRRRHRDPDKWFEVAMHAIEVSRVAKEERGFLAVRTGRALRQVRRKSGFVREGYRTFEEFLTGRCGFLASQVGRYMHLAELFRADQLKGKKLSFSAVVFIARQRQELWPVLLEYGSGHTQKSLELAIDSVAEIADEDEVVERLTELLQQDGSVIEEQAPPRARQRHYLAQCLQRMSRSMKSMTSSCELGINFFDEGYEMSQERARAMLEKTREVKAKLLELEQRLKGNLANRSVATAH